jgi:hypothetical protein
MKVILETRRKHQKIYIVITITESMPLLVKYYNVVPGLPFAQ